ncbi:hypothetical protein [Erythrobacter sp. R86502]|uniref:hypothetical protein n=1 Tax=Erythrobacter sp. R86502 TaxID=3093846 RepID=UPI0036D24CAE
MHIYRLAMIAAAPAAIAGLWLSPLAAQEGAGSPTNATEGERQLAKMLDGRVAGEPVRCIRAFANGRMTTINGTAYVFGSGNTIYVQRTRDPQQIDEDDALVSIRTGGTELCRLDQMRAVNRLTGFFTGAVFFEDFVPYTRRESDEVEG